MPPGSAEIRSEMTIIDTSFKAERAPCGKILPGQRQQDRDDECVLTDERFYSCGCVTIRHEYHDGTFSRREVRHDGKVIVDRMNVEH